MMKLNIQLFASGNITFATSGALQGKIDWTSTSNGSIANTSNVTARIYARRTSGTTTGRTWNGNVNIGGNNHTYSQIYTGTSTTIGTSWVLIETFSNTITHNDDGSKTITISGSVSGPSGTTLEGVTSSGSNSSCILDTIPRASVLNNTTFNPETNNALNITKYVESYYHILEYYTLNEAGTGYVSLGFAYNVENNDIVELTTDNLSLYYDENTSRSITTIKLKLITYSDAEFTQEVGTPSEKIITYTITNANPTFTDFDYADTNSTTTALTGNSSIIVNKYSNVKVDVPTGKKAVAIKGATMANYNVNGNLRTYAENFTYTINNLSAIELVVYAIDSRGNSKRVSKPLTVKAYTDLVKLTQGATREDGVGTQVTFDITGTYWNYSFGSVTNNVTATYRYRIVGTESWTTGLTAITLVKSGANFSFNDVLRGDAVDNGFEIANGYEIEIIVSDELTSKTFNCNISPSSPALEVYKNNVSLGGIYDETLGGRVQLLGKYELSEENNHAKIEDTPINIISNLTTATEGLGLLDAHQGKVLNDKIKGSTLWTNSNPSNAFASQTITLSSSNYDELMVYCGVYKGDSPHRVQCIIVPKNYSGLLNIVGSYSSNIGGFCRDMIRVSDTSFNISGCTIFKGTGSTASNDFAIPLYIVGIKRT